MAPNDGPPAGQFPDDYGSQAGGDGAGSGGGRQRREAPKFDIEAETKAFYAWIDSARARQELQAVLPDSIDVPYFVRVAKTAVVGDPKLLNPEWRPSLMRCLARAAGQGLLPDGKEGALIPRFDDKASVFQICWQPIVWGITKLARLTGQIQKIYAEIAFEGEPFEVLGGENEGRIIHKIVPSIVDEAYQVAAEPLKFMEQVAAVYCIVTTSGGDKVSRWMPRSRIVRVRASSKAARGPWNGPFQDEMCRKTIILWTTKWLDLNTDNPATARFREALETDMEADFDRAGNVIEHEPARSVAALPAPAPKLDSIMDQLNARNAREAERVTVGGATRQDNPPQQPRQMPAEQQASAGGVPSSAGASQAAPGNHTENPPQSGAGETEQSAPIERRPPSNQQAPQERQERHQEAPPAHGQQKPPAAQKTATPPVAQAPVVAPNSPEAAARKFVADTKQDIKMVASQEGLDGLLKNPAVRRRIDRLQESFPKLYDELMAAVSLRQQQFGPPDAGNSNASTEKAA
jgi:recombination protein RecT